MHTRLSSSVTWWSWAGDWPIGIDHHDSDLCHRYCVHSSRYVCKCHRIGHVLYLGWCFGPADTTSHRNTHLTPPTKILTPARGFWWLWMSQGCTPNMIFAIDILQTRSWVGPVVRYLSVPSVNTRLFILYVDWNLTVWMLSSIWWWKCWVKLDGADVEWNFIVQMLSETADVGWNIRVQMLGETWWCGHYVTFDGANVIWNLMVLMLCETSRCGYYIKHGVVDVQWNLTVRMICKAP